MRFRIALAGSVSVVVALGTFQLVRGAGEAEETVFVPIDPCRLVDTRPAAPIGDRTSPIGPAGIATFDVHGTNGDCDIPPSAKAVSANITAANPTALSFLTVFPAGGDVPIVSSLNWTAGASPTPNAVVIPLSSEGEFSLFNNDGTVNVIIDLNGYYQASSNVGAPGPAGADGADGADGVFSASYAHLRGLETPVASGATTTLDVVDPVGDPFPTTFDTGGFYDATEDTIVIPAAGVYQISTRVRFDAATAGTAQQVRVKFGGVEVPVNGFEADGGVMYVTGTLVESLAAGTIVEVKGRQASGVTIDIVLEDFNIVLLGPPPAS